MKVGAQKTLKWLLSALLVIALLAIACSSPTPVVVEKEVIREVPVERVVEKEVVKEVPVERVVEVEKFVEKEIVVEVTPVPEEKEPPKVCWAGPTPGDEPWVGAVGAGLEAASSAGMIIYPFRYHDDIGYGGAIQTVLRSMAEEGCDAIFVDAFLQEKAVRDVAAEYPTVPFIIGSEGGPVKPNVSVFDNWVQDAAYLAGLIAGGMTESDEIAVVAAIPIGEVNRIVNAFTQGVHMVTPQATVRTAFIGGWFDIDKAQDAASAAQLHGADVFFAERTGVIEWVCANEAGWAIGNMVDQNDLCSDRVLTSVTWNTKAMAEYVAKQVAAGTYTAQDLKDFNMMYMGGAAIAPFYGLEDEVAARTVIVDNEQWSLLDYVQEVEAEIKNGTFRVPIVESPPPAVVGPVE